MPIFSLPNKTGIGSIGKSAFDFIDFLSDSGQAYWQILPIQPPAKANSPYLSFSASAGDPNLIDLEWLVGDGHLTQQDLENCGVTSAATDVVGANREHSPYPSGKINYDNVNSSRKKVFAILYDKFFPNPPEEYLKFIEDEKIWLNNFSLFMAIRWVLAKRLEIDDLEDERVALWNWPDKFKLRDLQALAEFKKNHTYEINYFKMQQYCFFMQWKTLQDYAHKKGIQIIGDIPFYVALDSCDAWSDHKIFKMNDDFSVNTFSGCPPNKSNNKDSVGQVWDSPVYDWDYLKSTNYKWWTGRLLAALNLYDIIRIDHFKGFESYYCVDAKTRNPLTGHYEDGPGMDFWNTAAKELGYNDPSEMPIFAEDLGIITPPLQKLLHDTGFHGMKILQFAFNNTRKAKQYIGPNRFKAREMYLPHNITPNKVAYVGTHDNNTLKGWIDNIHESVLKNAQNYFEEKNPNRLFDKMLMSIVNSDSNTCILSAQDLLKLGADARNNTPGTMHINWMWQMTEMEMRQLDADWLLKITKEAGRL